ncbi:MAG TPA: hypothetical protein VF478_11805, partial [Anaerolineae bacterium]
IGGMPGLTFGIAMDKLPSLAPDLLSDRRKIMDFGRLSDGSGSSIILTLSIFLRICWFIDTLAASFFISRA